MSDKPYDCTLDILEHRTKVAVLIYKLVDELKKRAIHHDESKLSDPVEKEIFDLWTPELRKAPFGSEEYKVCLEAMGEGLQRHYRANSHHPEHWTNGIRGMSLIDILEMVCDWKAAAERSGKPVDLDQVTKRFKIDPQLLQIIYNTLKDMEGLE